MPSGGYVAPSWVGVRTRRYVYVEYYRAEVATLDQGFGLPIGAGPLTDTELYDLERDPHELTSRPSDIAYAQTKAAARRGARGAARVRRRDCQVDVQPAAADRALTPSRQRPPAQGPTAAGRYRA